MKRIRQGWGRAPRSRLGLMVTAGLALLTTGALPSPAPVAAEVLHAGITIYIPIELPDGTIIIAPRRQAVPRREVQVQFIAEGSDWASIYIDGRLRFNAFNTRRNYTLRLPAGGYRLQVTGTSRFDVWDSGYLDIGRNDANIVIVRYSKTAGVRVQGDPYVWLPD